MCLTTDAGGAVVWFVDSEHRFSAGPGNDSHPRNNWKNYNPTVVMSLGKSLLYAGSFFCQPNEVSAAVGQEIISAQQGVDVLTCKDIRPQNG